MTVSEQDPRKLSTLLAIMKALRDPDNGCPWDVKQTFKSITPYTIEEAYEVVDAIERDDMNELCDELGDLLLQVVFHAQMACEQNSFDFNDVVQAICNKMIRRHPHVFGTDEQRGKTPQKGFWEDIKAAEKRQTGKGEPKPLLLDNIPTTLPALSRARKLQAKAARVGFDWPDIAGVYDKLAEELAEVKQAQIAGSREEIGDELGDLLFTVVNLTRHFGHDPEQVLRQANNKFQRRFNHIEKSADKPLKEYDLEQLEQLWQKAKTGTPP
jgi:MazG family protein